PAHTSGARPARREAGPPIRARRTSDWSPSSGATIPPTSSAATRIFAPTPNGTCADGCGTVPAANDFVRRGRCHDGRVPAAARRAVVPDQFPRALRRIALYPLDPGVRPLRRLFHAFHLAGVLAASGRR